jgi:AraC family transcriptional regulator of adaptative response / DNA-3-methyladenine glycosylase II
MLADMHTDVERCLAAVRSRDARFDGWFIAAVTTTRIYCRPSCPAVTPRAEHLRFLPTAAAAQEAGFRACKRCRPDAVPGSPEWNVRADVVARAIRLIADGVVDRDGVPGLAARLGYSVRQLERQLVAEVGAGPLALARAQRAATARTLLTDGTLPMSEIAYAAGFSSIRAFNETVRTVYAVTPTHLRTGRPDARTATPKRGAGVHDHQQREGAGTLHLRLPFRAPLCPDNLFGHLIATAVPGVEEWRDGAYRRTVRLPHGHGVVTLRPPTAPGADRDDGGHGDGDGSSGPTATGHVSGTLSLTDLRDLPAAISRCRRLLDLDADPVAVDDALRADRTLQLLVDKAPGRRIPGTVDPAELAVRAVLGQQVSTAAARTLAARLVRSHGEPIDDPAGGLTHLFPSPAALSGLDPDALAVPHARRRSLLALIRELAGGELDLGPGSDRERAREQLSRLPGIGPWTLELIAMRALGDPDAFLPGDLGVRRAAQDLGLPSSPGALTARATAWRPWRAYAVQYLWAAGDHPINRIPA